MHPDERHDAAPSPSEVHLTRIDVPFVDLTAFFVKASFALGLAFLLTSWLWVIVGTGVAGLTAGLLVLAGVPDWFEPATPPDPLPVVAAVAAPPAPAPEPTIVILQEPVVPLPVPPPEVAPPAVDPNRAATEAAQLAEIERARRERNARGGR
jgi:hypothetical protein